MNTLPLSTPVGPISNSPMARPVSAPILAPTSTPTSASLLTPASPPTDLSNPLNAPDLSSDLERIRSMEIAERDRRAQEELQRLRDVARYD